MDVAGVDHEAAQPLAEVPSDTEEAESLAGDEEMQETIKPVFFGRPILRMVKILLGATICTVMLNPPSSLFGTSTAAQVEVPPPLKLGLAAEHPSASALVMEAAAEAEETLEGFAEKVSAIIAPSAKTHIVRSEFKTGVKLPEVEAVLEADATHIVKGHAAGEVDAVEGDRKRYARSEARRTPVTASEVIEDESSAAVAETIEEREASSATPWLWRETNVLPHILFAAVVLIGFMVHLRSRILELVQSLPEAVRKIRP